MHHGPKAILDFNGHEDVIMGS